jgi:arylsulfatase A-like enzyme
MNLPEAATTNRSPYEGHADSAPTLDRRQLFGRAVAGATGAALLSGAQRDSGTGGQEDAISQSVPPTWQQASRLVVIIADDLNDYVGFLSGLPDTPALTPHMNGLASSGINYLDAHAAAPSCAPARVAMMWGAAPELTGIYSNRHYQWWKSPFLGPRSRKGRPSILRRLRAAGWATHGVGKIFHTGSTVDHDIDGWDDYRHFSLAHPRATEDLSVTTIDYHGDFGPQFQNADFPDHHVANYTAGFIETMPAQTALFVGIQKPHLPLVVPQEYFNRYTDAYGQVVPPFLPAGDRDDLPPAADKFSIRTELIEAALTNGDYVDLVHAYLATVSFADDMIGRILDAIDASPHASETAVVLTSDHGFAVGEKLTFSKFQLWEQGTHIPMVVRPAGCSHGSTVTSPVSQLDVAPTIAELVGLPPAPFYTGHSLLDPVADPALFADRIVLSAYLGSRTIGMAARNQQWSYIKYFEPGVNRRELYDRTADGIEAVNLANDTTMLDVRDFMESYLPNEPAPPIPD